MRRLAVTLGLVLAAGQAAAEDQAELEARFAVEELDPVAMNFGHFYEGPFHGPRGVTVDQRTGEVLVADTEAGLIGIFDGRMAPLFSFGDGDRLKSPVKVIPDARGRLLVLDGADRRRLRRYSYRGEFLEFVPMEGMEAQPGLSITAVALDDDGNLYVGDSGNGEILSFDARGRLRFRFGNKGVGQAEFSSIMGIVATREAIVVSDAAGLGIQVFDRRGRYRRGWGRHEAGRENVSFPAGLSVDAKGRIALADSLRHEVKLYRPDGVLIGQFCGMGSLRGEVLYPADVSFDGKGRIAVADRGNNRVQILQVREPARPAKSP
jgi:DNA-binding beta-propeller fold protein YncE